MTAERRRDPLLLAERDVVALADIVERLVPSNGNGDNDDSLPREEAA